MRSLREYPLEDVKAIVNKAKYLDENYYRVWHVWGATNYEWIQRNGEQASLHSVANNMDKTSIQKFVSSHKFQQANSCCTSNSSTVLEFSDANVVTNFVSGAIEGFINSIRL